MSRCQQNSSVPRGAVRIQRLNWGSAPKTPASARSAVPIIAAPPSPSASNEGAGRRGTIRSSNGERDAHGQISSASSSIATRRSRRRTSSVATSPSRCAAHRALVVGGGALALAGDLGRHEAQRVELGVGVLERGAGEPAPRSRSGARMRRTRRPRASARASRPGPSPSSSSRQRRQAWSRAAACSTITSCDPSAGCEANRLGSAVRRDSASGSEAAARAVSGSRAGILPAPRTAEPGRGSAPTARRQPGVSASPPPGRSAQTSGGVRSSRPSQKGQVSAASGFDSDRGGVNASGPLGAAGREDRPQAGELVDADLGAAVSAAGGSPDRVLELAQVGGGSSPGGSAAASAGSRAARGELPACARRVEQVDREREDDRRVLVARPSRAAVCR